MWCNYTMDHWSQTHGRVTLRWPSVYHLVVVGPSIVTVALLTTQWKERPSVSRINAATLKQRCHATNSLNPLRCITPWWWSKALSCYVSPKWYTIHDESIACIDHSYIMDVHSWIDGSREGCCRILSSMRRLVGHSRKNTVQIIPCRTHMVNTW